MPFLLQAPTRLPKITGDAPKSPSEDPSDFQNAGGPGTPTSLTFLGKLYGEGELLAFARAYQDATGFHLQHPKLAVEDAIVRGV